MNVEQVRVDDELLDALGRGEPAVDGEPLAWLLAEWRSELVDVADTPDRPLGAPRGAGVSVWMLSAAAVLLAVLAGLAVLVDVPLTVFPGMVGVVDTDDGRQDHPSPTPSPARGPDPARRPSVAPLPGPAGAGASSGTPATVPAPTPSPTSPGLPASPLPSVPAVPLPSVPGLPLPTVQVPLLPRILGNGP
jgi:hypothetical protein